MAKKQISAKPKRRSRGGFPINNAALPKSLAQVNLNAAGIDIGSTQHYVAVPADRDPAHVRCFGTFTSDLGALAHLKTEARARFCRGSRLPKRVATALNSTCEIICIGSWAST